MCAGDWQQVCNGGGGGQVLPLVCTAWRLSLHKQPFTCWRARHQQMESSCWVMLLTRWMGCSVQLGLSHLLHVTCSSCARAGISSCVHCKAYAVWANQTCT